MPDTQPDTTTETANTAAIILDQLKAEQERMARERKTLTSLDDFNAIVASEKPVDFTYLQRPYKVMVRPLTPKQKATLDLIYETVVPPMIKGKTFEDDRPDYSNAKFITAKKEAHIKRRSLGLYENVPLFAAKAPGLVGEAAITGFVQGQLNEQILEMLYNAIREGGVTLAELTNFSSTSNSAPS